MFFIFLIVTLQIWDTRSWKAPFSFKENHDFISSMAVDDGKRTLLATSGDGSLCVFDLRKRALEQRSDCNESELLSLAIVKVLYRCKDPSLPHFPMTH